MLRTHRLGSVEGTNPNARYCRVTVKGGRKADVAVTLQACRFDLSVCTNPVLGLWATQRRDGSDD